jgi:hypothetical protein
MLKSTEIVIEQLIIGLFFFLIIGIFIFGEEILPTKWPEPIADKLTVGALIFIAAYASGVVIDRWSDTILDRLFSINRIKTISNRLTYSELEKYSEDLLDPYPEACLRMEIYDKGGGIAEQHAYLRTRMRITRAITCLLPAFFLSIQTVYSGVCQQQRHIIGLLILLIYAILIITAIFAHKISDPPPKSYKIEKFKGYIEDRCGKCKKNKEEKLNLKFKPTEWICQSGSGLIIFVIISIVIAFNYSWMKPAGMRRLDLFPAALPLITLLVGRTWWRISETFFNFVLDFKDFKFSKK